MTRIFSLGLLIAIGFFGVAAAQAMPTAPLDQTRPQLTIPVAPAGAARAGIVTSTACGRPQCRATRSRSCASPHGRGSRSLRWSRQPSGLQRLPMLACLQLISLKKTRRRLLAPLLRGLFIRGACVTDDLLGCFLLMHEIGIFQFEHGSLSRVPHQVGHRNCRCFICSH